MCSSARAIVTIQQKQTRNRASPPARFNDLVKSIPRGKKVAAPAWLWFELVKAGHCPIIIGSGNPYELELSQWTLEKVNGFDIIIVFSEMADFQPVSIVNRNIRHVRAGSKNLYILERNN